MSKPKRYVIMRDSPGRFNVLDRHSLNLHVHGPVSLAAAREEAARLNEEHEEPWVVLGNKEHGVSWGPFTKEEAVRFAAGSGARLPIPLSGACSQLETCVAYGFDYAPRKEEK